MLVISLQTKSQRQKTRYHYSWHHVTQHKEDILGLLHEGHPDFVANDLKIQNKHFYFIPEDD